MNTLVREIYEVARHRELLKNLVVRDIKVRYKRSFLGFLWVMLNPLFMMLILSMVFSSMFKVSTKNYTVYLLSGLILWNFFAQSTSTSMMSFIGNGNLIKKTYFPRVIFPLSVVISAMINFAFSLVPLCLIFFITRTTVSSNIYLLPVILLIVGMFSFGISLILSTSIVFFHDILYIYEVLLLAWMYVTPIFYPETIIPAHFSAYFHMNPFYYFMNVFRSVLYEETASLPEQLFYSFLFSAAALAVGWLFYRRYKDRLIYYL